MSSPVSNPESRFNSEGPKPPPQHSLFMCSIVTGGAGLARTSGAQVPAQRSLVSSSSVSSERSQPAPSMLELLPFAPPVLKLLPFRSAAHRIPSHPFHSRTILA